MKTKEFKVESILDLIYDEESAEFKESFESYKECMDKNADITDMLKHVVWHLYKFGIETMVEGVGYISVRDQKRNFDPEDWSGIEITSDEFDLEVSEY